MWDSIPYQIQENILKRLRVISLLNFRSVSKACKSLIDSSAFIADYQHTELQQHILVRYGFEHNYVSVADDDTFPHQNVFLAVPLSVKILKPEIVGCSEGLFCFYDYFGTPVDPGKRTAVIWNPAIGKSVAIDVPNVLDMNKYRNIVCFGVCPHTLDPMLVQFSFVYCAREPFAEINWRVEIFRLSSGAWKSLSINLPLCTIVSYQSTAQVVIDRFIYRLASNMISRANLIISFDMISEVFTEIPLPDNLSRILNLSKLHGSLVVVEDIYGLEVPDFGVWMMENGDPKSFIKLFTINNNILDKPIIEGVIGFRKSGEVIIEVPKGFSLEEEVDSEISVYDPKSGHIDYTGISAKGSSIFVSAYTKTLLLLDRPDCISTSLWSIFNIGHFGAIE